MGIYSGFHVGIVVENDDPNYGGRVKVYVPEHSPNLEKLNNWIKEGKEIKFNAIDKDMSPELVEILDDLKESLPWADYAGPIFGGSSDGRFHCSKKVTSTNDDSSFGRNDAQNGYRPLNEFMGDGVPIDDFYVRDGRTIVMPNSNATDYEPTNYSGMVRGIFSIPNVGAQVYVFYLNEDPMYPVYFAAAYNPDSIKQIYSMTNRASDIDQVNKFWDYPGEFENSNEDTDESKIFRSKTVINSNKHTIEFIDTDGYEALRFQHFGGGFKQFHNYGAIEFTPGNDQQLVLGDQFLTVRQDRGVSIGGNESYRVKGNSHLQIGEYSHNVEQVTEIKKALDELGNIKRLFPVQRTSYDLPPKDTSTLQIRAPAKMMGFITCPTCGGFKYDPYNVNGLNAGGTYFNDQVASGQAIQQAFFKTHIALYDNDGREENIEGDGFIKTKNTNIKDDIEYGWSRIPKAITYCYAEFYTPPPYFSPEYLAGTETADEKEDASIDDYTKVNPGGQTASPHAPHAGTGKLGVFGGIRCPTCNNKLWQESDQTSVWAVTGASGLSPSTENGMWVEELRTKSAFSMQAASKFREVAQSLQSMGDGGDRIETITMSKVENIGTVFNDIPSYRVDPIGKLRLDGLFVTQQSTVPYYLPTPHVEPVDVTNVPGGDYNLTIGNKWNVMVGSNGINIKTTGSLQIGGAISSIATQELNLSAKHDMIIDGGERLMIRARKVTVNPVEHNALSIDGQLHVLRNMIVRGGALIEGELAVQHVTAPGELALTGPEIWVGGTEERCCIPAGLKIDGGEMAALNELKMHHFALGVVDMMTGGLVTTITGLFGHKKKNKLKATINGLVETVNGIIELLNKQMEVSLCLPIHKHTFLQIPTTFKDCPNGVRAELLGEKRNINSRQMVVAAKRRHHIGAFSEDPFVQSVYVKNQAYFDGLVYDAIIGDAHNAAAGLAGDLSSKGINRTSNRSMVPANPTNFGAYVISMSNGNQGEVYFYTVVDYYSSRNPLVCPVKDKELGNDLTTSAQYCKLTFDIAKEDDSTSMGNLGGTNQSSTTMTNQYNPADLALGYIKGSEKAVMVGTSQVPYSKQKYKAKMDAQLAAWNGKFGSGSSVCPV